MKKDKFFSLISRLAGPVMMALLGFVMVLSPDSASALAGKVLGWGCVLGALLCAFSGRSGLRIAGGLLLGAAGVWMLSNPLFLARLVGRILGALLLLQGLRDLSPNTRSGRAGTVLAALTTLLGVVLVLLPLTTSRLMFTILGILLILLGIAECIERLRSHRQLGSGDTRIIDVEKL